MPKQKKKKKRFNLLILPYFLLAAYGAELLSLLVGYPEVVLRRPQVVNPDDVGAHEEQRVGHQLRRRRQRRHGRQHFAFVYIRRARQQQLCCSQSGSDLLCGPVQGCANHLHVFKGTVVASDDNPQNCIGRTYKLHTVFEFVFRPLQISTRIYICSFIIVCSTNNKKKKKKGKECIVNISASREQ